MTRDAKVIPRLLIVTQWFDPEPTPRGLAFAKALKMRGFDVQVVTGFPNYPGGRLYSGYKIKLWQRETIDGVSILRLPLFPSHNSRAISRAANYISFFLSVLVYLAFFAKKADIAYVYHPPLTVSLAAAIARYIRRTPTIIDIQDLWPDTIRATGMIGNQRLLSIIDSACNWLYRHVDHIVVLSPGFKRILVSRNVAESKITQIYNWADAAEVQTQNLDIVPDSMKKNEKFRVLFAGNMGKAQGLDTVLDAAKLVAFECPSVELILMGGGVELEHLKSRVMVERIDNVTFLPRVSMKDAKRFLVAADALLVHLKLDPLFEITIPSKTQAYMAAGRPIIMAVPGDAAELVVQAKGGIVALSENPQSVSYAICKIAKMDKSTLSQMSENNREFYLLNLSAAKGVSMFADTFFSIMKMRR
jgi:colanic acid biosynthesis glycosyl transferase WcaI